VSGFWSHLCQVKVTTSSSYRVAPFSGETGAYARAGLTPRMSRVTRATAATETAARRCFTERSLTARSRRSMTQVGHSHEANRRGTDPFVSVRVARGRLSRHSARQPLWGGNAEHREGYRCEPRLRYDHRQIAPFRFTSEVRFGIDRALGRRVPSPDATTPRTCCEGGM
jgi:hypothetical protein